MPIVADHFTIGSIAWLRSHGIVILIILATALVLSAVVGLVIGRVRRRSERAERIARGIDERGRRRIETLSQVLRKTIRAIIWSVAALTVLGEFGVDLAPLIAGAGLVGLALGFGAQALVRDFLSGFFILLENQFHVGDPVLIRAEGGPVEGVVEGFSLRVTQVRSADGGLHFVPNGFIEEVENRTDTE
ncbi:MAG: mechanosensitive ion channel family protein, partial [Actinomycetota bacterium]